MIPVEQDILAPPLGNCFAACVASIFELPLAAVPNFVTFGDDWWDHFDAWLKSRGLSSILVSANEVPPPRGYAIICLDSDIIKVGRAHHVVALDGDVVWDPSPNRAVRLGAPRYWVVLTVLDPSKHHKLSCNAPSE